MAGTDPDDVDTFSLLGWVWDVTAATELAAGLPAQSLELESAAGMLSMIYVDEEHAKTVDLAEPVIVVRCPEAGSTFLIDGWHRVHRALAEGRTDLPCKVLDPDQEYQVRLYGGRKGLPPRPSLAERMARREAARARREQREGEA